MNIIKEAGHPIFTGVVPLAKGKLMNEGKTEHFAKDYHNEQMLIKLIYDSNMLAAFLALWKHVPQQPQMSSPTVPKDMSAKKAGGDPSRASDACRASGKGPKLAAGARSEVKTPDNESEAEVKKKSAEEAAEPAKRKRHRRGPKQVNKRAMPENLSYFLYKQIEQQMRETKKSWLTSEAAIESICRLARFPFPVRPGDWFKTRPASMDPKTPALDAEKSTT